MQNLQIALGRRFRPLKIWFTLRAFGLDAMRDYLRQVYGILTRLSQSRLCTIYT